MKKPLSRSQRGSKVIKGKHVLQLCVLLGVCIWLIYQLKYSHDKKKEFFEKDGKKSSVSLLADSKAGLIKLGRKDLLPGYHDETEEEKHVEEDDDEEEEIKNNGNHEDEKEEIGEDEDNNRQGKEVIEEDEEENRHEEAEIDEQDPSKTGGDTDKDDEFLEEENKSGSNDRADDIDMTVDEARDEHYRADDASSAVSHESWTPNTEKLIESSGNSYETSQETSSNASISEVEIHKEPVLKLGEAKISDFVNKTTTRLKDVDSDSSSSVIKSVVTESQGKIVDGNSTVAVLEASGFLQNETEIMQNRSQEVGTPLSDISDLQTVMKFEQNRNASDHNITVSANITTKASIQDGSRNSTSETSLIENISGSNTTEVKEDSLSEGVDESGEKESANLFSAEEADDTSENSISQEEMEAFTDPDTLPDIRIEGNEEDEEEAIAAE